jgi:diphthamide synthase (EF-2-diphthine--ammonia ligase)
MGFKAYLSCVEGKVGPGFVGRPFDYDLLKDLPADVDPCGEYGEFHSFVYDGPIFQYPVPVRVGEIVVREGRYYADLLPEASTAPIECVAEMIPPV